MTREPIPKTIRFEVFKRDKFTCQYCGASAPDVILEIDHIQPVSKGGTNELLNLVTSCRNCNRGKSNKELSDDSAVKVQKQQLDDMQDRREQMKMMLEWRRDMDDLIEDQMEAIDRMFDSDTDYVMGNRSRKEMSSMIRKFGFNEVYEACQIAISRYYTGTEWGWRNMFSKIGGICYNRQKEREKDA